jgi:type I restriction enzyme S subunit
MTSASAQSTDTALANLSREIVPLGKVATIVSGFGFPKELQGKTEGALPFFKVGDISAAWNSGRQMLTTAQHYLSEEEARSIKARAFPKGTIVFAKIGEAIKLNRRAILGQPALVDNNVMGLVPNYEVVDHRYLFYWTLTQKLGDISQATTVPSIRKSDVEELEFPLVRIDHQKLIVAEIEKQFSRLDEAVANLKRVKANLKRYKAAVLKAAVEGRLVETEAELARREGRSYETGEQLLQRILETRRSQWQGKGKYKEPVAPDTTTLPELPVGWVWASLGQLVWSIKDGPHFSPKYSEEGIPFISGGNIRPEGIDFSKSKFISPELHEEFSKRCKPEYGNLLYTKGGTTGIARVNTETREFNVWVHVAVLKLMDSIEPFYLQHALNSQHCYRQAQKYTHGVGNQDLGLTRMVWITIPLPSTQEQKRIVTEVDRRLSLVRETESQVDANLLRAERLRQSVLRYAFSGNVGEANMDMKQAV